MIVGKRLFFFESAKVFGAFSLSVPVAASVTESDLAGVAVALFAGLATTSGLAGSA